ncbi:MAG: CBS domain-containing protein [Fermentimonas sp.]|nr:CBS domain-containing protein [Fermentimonas sp.]
MESNEKVTDYEIENFDDSTQIECSALVFKKEEFDPVKKISLVDAAKRPPVTVSSDNKIMDAITKMMYNDYSQLPVTSGSKTIKGFVSWETIGNSLINSEFSLDDPVSKYTNTEIVIVSIDEPLLKAVAKVLKKDFVVVVDKTKALSGLVTTSDISAEYLSLTERFLIIEQIENRVRYMMEGKFSTDEIQQLCNNENKQIQYLEDLSFGDYIRILQKEENWSKLGLSINKKYFLKELNDIRIIRNKIMHFKSNSLSKDDFVKLRLMVNFLEKIS